MKHYIWKQFQTQTGIKKPMICTDCSRLTRFVSCGNCDKSFTIILKDIKNENKHLCNDCWQMYKGIEIDCQGHDCTNKIPWTKAFYKYGNFKEGNHLYSCFNCKKKKDAKKKSKK